MRVQKFFLILVLSAFLVPFQQIVAQTPSPTPLPDDTEIMNSIPGLTAFTDNNNKEKQASDALGRPLPPFTAWVKTIMSFGAGVDKKSTFVDFDEQAAILGQAYDKDQPGGGKLMPKMKQDELIKPQYRENANHTEQFTSVYCSNLSNQEKQKKINELMAVTERVPLPYYDSYWETSVHAAINGTTPNGIKSTKFYAPPQDFFTYDPATDNYILKPEHEKDLYDCGAQSAMNKTSEVPIKVFGAVTSNTKGLPVSATLQDIWNFLTGIPGCIINAKECADRYMALTTQVTYTAILPFAPDRYAKATGGMRNYTNFPAGAPADKVALLKGEKGVYNIYYPKQYIDKYLTIGYDDAHAGTKRTSTTEVSASPLDVAIGPTEIPHAGLKAEKLRFSHAVSCPIQPKMKQDDERFDCSARPINTSDWAIGQGDGNGINPRFNPPPATQGSIQQAIEQATKKVGIPQCVLEGAAQIEGAYGWQLDDSRIAECRPNVCSAAGPFQITIGRDANGDRSCPSCPSKWVEQYGCPNTWGSDPESPCNYAHAAQRAAQILIGKAANYGYTLDNRPPAQQKEAIISAGNGYYGGSVTVPRLGNCSYGEFVYKHCDPSYQCKAAQ